MTTINDIDFNEIRADFPMMQAKNRGESLIYLDSAASSQKPKQVLDAVYQFYAKDYANIHRGIYELSGRATSLYEETRKTIAQFVNAPYSNEIIFVRSTTEGINLVANSLSQFYFEPQDEILLSELEHHSNIVPWYRLKKECGVVLKIIPVKEDGSLDLDVYQTLFSSRTKLVAVSHVSNALGTINPVKMMTKIAHQKHVPVLIDGAQAVPHMPIDLQDINCDFYAFSGHKLYAPTGVGVLYAKRKWLDVMPPFQSGGDMIETVSFDQVTYAKAPQKFEAGTPDIGGVIGLSAAIRYLNAIGMSVVAEHEKILLAYANLQLEKIEGLRIIGTAYPKVGVISFVMKDIHPHDIGTVLDHEGIAIRAGHHCAMPLMAKIKVSATARLSFGVYNNEEDIDALIAGLHLVKRLF